MKMRPMPKDVRVAAVPWGHRRKGPSRMNDRQQMVLLFSGTFQRCVPSRFRVIARKYFLSTYSMSILMP